MLEGINKFRQCPTSSQPVTKVLHLEIYTGKHNRYQHNNALEYYIGGVVA